MTTPNFELAPTPRPDGTPKSVSERLNELNVSRFIAVRNLATMHYKNPDGTSLMEYKDTLQDRDAVRKRVIEFEILNGWVTPDQAGFTTTSASPVEAAQIGTPQMVSFSAPLPPPPAPVAQPTEMSPMPKINGVARM